MNSKTRNIIEWVLTGIVAFIFIGSGFSKITADAEGLKGATAIGVDATSFRFLGVIELIASALFIYKRTAVIGTLLLVAYMGGAIATHLEHGQPLLFPVLISAFVWIVAVVKLPELSNRLLNKQ
jgi:uncharacterized membrane protein YphA (DoxX/SURF4 family)